MKSLALILGLFVAVQALPAKGPTPLDVYMPVIGGAPVPIAPKVVGGQAAKLGQFPHMAAILIGSSAFCSGSLIARNWILTAAQCTPASSFQVNLGSIQLQGDGGVSVVTTMRIVHANYSSSTLANDIALLRLPGQVVLTNNIQLVTLTTAADASNTFTGVTAQLSGFGKAADNRKFNPDLMWVELPIITNAECAQTFGGRIISSTICTSGAGDRGPCYLDYGGPLVITRDGGFTQIGVVSIVSSISCGYGAPSGYTRVTSFRTWIQQITGV